MSRPTITLSEPGEVVDRPERDGGRAVESEPQPGTPVRSWMWFAVVTVAAVAVTVVAAWRSGSRVASRGEADIAAAAFAQRRAELGVPLAQWPDVPGVRQLAALMGLLDGTTPDAVVTAARVVLLLVGLVTGLLLWPVARRLAAGPPAAAVAVAVAVLPGPVVFLHGAVNTATLSALWLVLGGLFAGRGPAGSAAAAAALSVAIVTAPLAAVPVLVFVAHAGGRRELPGMGHWLVRRMVSVALLAAAVVVTVLAVGTGPWVTTGGPPLSTPAVVTGVVAALLLIGVAWLRLAWFRPVVSGAAVALMCALPEGPSRATALLLACPAVAIVVAVLIDDLADHVVDDSAGDVDDARSPRRRLLAPGAATVALIAALPALLASAPMDQAAGEPLVRWMSTDVAADQVVHVDGLSWAELVRAGIPPARLSLDPRPGALDVTAERIDSDRPAPGEVLVTLDGGPGNAVTTVTAPGWNPPEVMDAERDQRRRLGTALTASPSLTLTDTAVQTLRDGQVDPRLMVVVSAASSSLRLGISAFPMAPGAGPDALRRTAVITTVNGEAISTPAAESVLRQWLDVQVPPFRPSALTTAPDGMQVTMSAPSMRALPGASGAR